MEATMQATPSPFPRFIAIASGKGGVGKTWFAVTLAHALAQAGRRVLLVDLDLGLANVDIQLGLVPRHDLGDVLEGHVSFAAACAPVPQGGFQVLAGRSGSGALAGADPARLDRVAALLGENGAGFDHVLLDLGAGLEGAVRHFAAWAQTVLVLATDEPTSLTDAYATLKLHAGDRPGGDARIVINQATSPAAARRTAEALRRACATFLGRTPPVLGAIRSDRRVADAIRAQTLLRTRHPASPASEDVGRIAALLTPAPLQAVPAGR